MDQNNKYFYITGEVMKRVFNPEVTSDSGKKYYLCYLVVKWVSGRMYEDYVPVKVFSPKHIDHVRAGYIVKVPVKYSCPLRKGQSEIEYKNHIRGNVNIEEPKLWPSIVLDTSQDIEIINDENNFENNQQANINFENEVLNKIPEDPDDLPF